MNNKILWLILGILAVGEIYLFGIFFGFFSKPDNSAQINTQKSGTVASSSTGEEGPTLNILITNKGFEPPTNTVKPGTTIFWLNSSDKPVAVSLINRPDRLVYSKLNLGVIEKGQTVSIKFDATKRGIYSYVNDYKPSQTGDIVIK